MNPSTYQPINLSTQPEMNPSTYQPINLSTQPEMNPSTHQPINLSTRKEKFALTFLAILISGTIHAANDWTDTFYRSGKYFTVVAVLAIIFVGIVVYLIRLDRKISKLEKKDKP
jgi:CcmD family protein